MFQVELLSRGKWRRTPMAFGSEAAARAWIDGRGEKWRVMAVSVGCYTPSKPTKEFLRACEAQQLCGKPAQQTFDTTFKAPCTCPVGHDGACIAAVGSLRLEAR